MVDRFRDTKISYTGLMYYCIVPLRNLNPFDRTLGFFHDIGNTKESEGNGKQLSLVRDKTY